MKTTLQLEREKMKTVNNEQFLSVSEASKMLNMSASSVRSLSEKELPCIRNGKSKERLFRYSDVIKYKNKSTSIEDSSAIDNDESYAEKANRLRNERKVLMDHLKYELDGFAGLSDIDLEIGSKEILDESDFERTWFMVKKGDATIFVATIDFDKTCLFKVMPFRSTTKYISGIADIAISSSILCGKNVKLPHIANVRRGTVQDAMNCLVEQVVSL